MDVHLLLKLIAPETFQVKDRFCLACAVFIIMLFDVLSWGHVNDEKETIRIGPKDM